MKERVQLNCLASTLAQFPGATQLLERAGFDLVVVANMQETLDAVAQALPDIILLESDTTLPNFLQLQSVIRNHSQDKQTQVLLFVNDEIEQAVNSFHSVDIYHLLKPRDTNELLQCLSKYNSPESNLSKLAVKQYPFEEALSYYDDELKQSKHAQRSLARQLWKERERLSSSQSVARVGSWETDLSNFTVEWTEQTHQIFGTDPASFLPTHEGFLALVHPQDREQVDAAFQHSLQTRTSGAIVHRIVRPDGVQRIVEERWSVFKDDKHKAIRAVGACQDITEQQLAEEDRDRLFRLSGDLLAISTLEGKLIQVNPAWTNVLGWPKEEIENNYALKFLHPDDLERSRSTNTPIRNGETIRNFENRFLCNDGSYRWISWNTYPFLEAKQIYSIGRDITESKLAKAGLDELEDRLKFMSEAVNMGYWDLDLVTSQAWRSLSHDQCFGYESLLDEWSYDIFIRHVHLDDRNYVDRTVSDTIANGSIFKIEFRVVWPDLSIHWIYCIGRITRDKEGKAVQMLGVVLDISDRKSLEGQLRQSQRLESMGQMTGGIAHDFNNLLTIIIGNSETLKQELQGNAELAPLTDMVLDAADRGAALVKRMLAFSRKQRLEPITLNINELIETLQPLVERSLGASATLELSLSDKLWLCRIDPSELENCVLNLAINARDAMHENGRLLISTRNKTVTVRDVEQSTELTIGDYVQISVEDNGIGMNEEMLAQILEPYFTTKPTGSGLGLAMVYGFIKQSGGCMFIQSEPKQGTRIELYIPAVYESE